MLKCLKRIIFLFLIIFIDISLVYSEVINIHSTVKIPGCGDGICDINESCSNCKIDCGECFIPSGYSNGGGSGGGYSGGRGLPNQEIIGNKSVGSIVRCNESWICDEWTECNNDRQKRGCYDLHACNTSLNKPVGEKECKKEVKIEVNEYKDNNSYLLLFFTVFMLIISYILLKKVRKTKRKKRR